MVVPNVFSGAFVDDLTGQIADAPEVLMRGYALNLWASNPVWLSTPLFPGDCSRPFLPLRAACCFLVEFLSTFLDVTLRRSIKVIASGSLSWGMYFCFEVDGLGSTVEWDDARGLAEWRGGGFTDEVDDASRCAAESGVARLDTRGSEARGAKDKEEAEELPDSGRRSTEL